MFSVLQVNTSIIIYIYIDDIPNRMKVRFDFAERNDSLVIVEDENQYNVNAVYNFMGCALKFIDKKIEYTWEYKNGIADNIVNFFDTKKHTLPIGLIARMCSLLKSEYKDIKIELSPRIRSMFTPPVQLSDDDIIKYLDTLNIYNRKSGKHYSAYEHQLKLINCALNHRRGSLMACTSAGKSLSIYAISRYLTEVEHRKVLVIVPSKYLVKQMFANFYDDYGWDDAESNCTLIYGESKDKITAKKRKQLSALNLGDEALLKPITISTWQSLQKKEESFFKHFQAVIVDEAHGERGPVLRSIVECCTNAENFKIGVSGTLPDEGLDAGYIESTLGKKYEIIRLKTLIDKHVLTPVQVKALYVPYPMGNRPFICRAKYDEELSMVNGNTTRRDVMDMLIQCGHITVDQNTVVLFKNKTVMQMFYNHMLNKHPQFTYHIIEGEVKVSERDKICSALEESNGNILIGTYGCLQQGVNVKNLHNLVFGEPAKSIYAVCQSIGRIVRPNEGKTQATCYDIVDDASYITRGGNPNSNYLLKHFYERKTYYDADEIPVHKIDLSGIIEGSVEVDSIKERRKAKAAQKASKPQSKQKWLSSYRRQF